MASIGAVQVSGNDIGAVKVVEGGAPPGLAIPVAARHYATLRGE